MFYMVKNLIYIDALTLSRNLHHCLKEAAKVAMSLCG